MATESARLNLGRVVKQRRCRWSHRNPAGRHARIGVRVDLASGLRHHRVFADRSSSHVVVESAGRCQLNGWCHRASRRLPWVARTATHQVGLPLLPEQANHPHSAVYSGINGHPADRGPRPRRPRPTMPARLMAQQPRNTPSGSFARQGGRASVWQRRIRDPDKHLAPCAAARRPISDEFPVASRPEGNCWHVMFMMSASFTS